MFLNSLFFILFRLPDPGLCLEPGREGGKGEIDVYALKRFKNMGVRNKISDILDELMGKYVSIYELKEKLENIEKEKCTYYIDYHYTPFSDAHLYVGEISVYTRYELGLDKLICKDFEA